MTENNGTPEEQPAPGYWEQQAAAQPPAPSPPPYGQQPTGQSPYPPPPYYAPGYQQGQYPQGQYPQGQYQQPYVPYAVPDHPRATTALVLGLIGVVGGLLCVVPILVSPFAWAIGAKARREIRQSNGQLGGDGSATAGMVLGIIGTVLLALAVIAIVVLVIVAINDPTAFNDTSTV